MASTGSLAGVGVWVLHPSNDWYGADVMLHTTVEVLLAAGAEVRVTLADDARSTVPTPLQARLEVLGVDADRARLPVLRRNRKNAPGALELARMLPAFLRLSAAAPERVVLVNSSSLALCVPLLRPRRERWVVSYLHETMTGVEGWLLGTLLGCSHTIVTVSVAARAALPGRSRRRAQVVPNAGAQAIGEPTPLPEGPLRFLFIGRWSRRKGIDELLTAWRVVDSPDRHLTVIGGYPSDGVHAAFDAREITLPSVTVVGEVPDVVPWIDESHVVVVPSMQPEGLGMVALEALSRGRPVLATAAGGLRDVVDDSVGWVLPPDPSGWPDVLREITRAAVEQRQQPCLALYRRRFSPEIYRDRIVDVIGGSRGPD